MTWILDDAPFLQPTASLPSPRWIMKTFKADFDLAYARYVTQQAGMTN